MRRAQAAVEYLLMITVALMMVALVIKYVKQVAEQTGQMINSSASQLNEYVNKSWKNISG
ncbi:class III signal peptide-containing protein [Thermococcus sp.]|uniref:class III signal peptide-containing protein n=1 Tax=Thermococcus sp. TaxID=35749 RepID=UPI00260D4BA3|nr:class III signal peptide-containing protein [Thermococcus sp.]